MPFDKENLGNYWKICPIKSEDYVSKNLNFLNKYSYIFLLVKILVGG